jgi:hypothetical protein
MSDVVDVNYVVSRVKAAGATNCRVVPMAGQQINGGLHQIEVKDNGTWTPVAVNIDKAIAENIVSHATNRVICG